MQVVRLELSIAAEAAASKAIHFRRNPHTRESRLTEAGSASLAATSLSFRRQSCKGLQPRTSRTRIWAQMRNRVLG